MKVLITNLLGLNLFDTLSSKDTLLFRLCSGWNFNFHLTGQSRNANDTAKDGLTHSDRNIEMQVISISCEVIVRVDAELDVEVSVGLALLALRSLTRQANVGSSVNARRNLDLDGSLSSDNCVS